MNDPVGAGLVATLAHPGGNVTGFTPAEFSIGGKLLELLKEIAPSAGQVGALLDPGLSDQIGMWHAMEAAAPSAGVQLLQLPVQDRNAIERAIDELAATMRYHDTNQGQCPLWVANYGQSPVRSTEVTASFLLPLNPCQGARGASAWRSGSLEICINPTKG